MYFGGKCINSILTKDLNPPYNVFSDVLCQTDNIILTVDQQQRSLDLIIKLIIKFLVQYSELVPHLWYPIYRVVVAVIIFNCWVSSEGEVCLDELVNCAGAGAVVERFFRSWAEDVFVFVEEESLHWLENVTVHAGMVDCQSEAETDLYLHVTVQRIWWCELIYILFGPTLSQWSKKTWYWPTFIKESLIEKKLHHKITWPLCIIIIMVGWVVKKESEF